ncbi:MAG: hypothetical protein GY844_01770 [Bradyrhizobium sp.]|nr:hypothetical protein [Bradyrhizobium sp.]
MALPSLSTRLFACSLLSSGMLLCVSKQAEAADPPVLTGPITKCDAQMEYLSRIRSTGRAPPYELTNSLRNNGSKSVTDVAWPKPDLRASELKVMETLEETYPVSAYVHDKDAPVKFWYQGCSVPAEAYLRTEDKSDKGFSLRSLLRKFGEAPSQSSATAEVTVSLEGNTLQLEITRQPQDAQVGLTGIERWLTPSSVSEIEGNAKEYGYTATIAPVSRILRADEREKLAKQEARWPDELALITRRVSGDKNYLRIRLNVTQSSMRTSRATVALVRPDGSLIAAGSYATFIPER